MPSWDMGYKSEILYTYIYFEATNPLWNKFIMAHSGLAFPDLSKGGYACELGFGQGLSVNVHALTSNTEWYGNDFNPTQTRFAQRTASISDVKNVHLYDDSFKQLAERTDLPQFDYVYLHGIWSWISRENQQYIVDFLEKHLKVGGVVYISYNVSPGFQLVEPVRNLMKQFDDSMLAPTVDNDARMLAMQEYLVRLFKHSPSFLQANPSVVNYALEIFKKDAHYISNEYLNDDWDIIHFSDMAQTLERAKLQFACSSAGGQFFDKYRFTPEQSDFLSTLRGNTLVYEETRDFMIHEYFRRDLFVKGKEVLTHSQKMKQLRTLHFVFARETDKFDFTIASSKGPIQLPLEYYEPIFNFCKDHRVHSYAEVLDTFADKDVNGYHITEDNVLEVLQNLTLSNTIMPAAAPEALSPEIIERTKHFNRVILLEEPDSPIKFLVSPITQSGMYFNDVLRALLREYMRDSHVSPEQLKQMLAKRTEGLQVSDEIKKKIDDKQLTMEDMVNETVDKFFSDYLPLYKSLEII